ncbi:MAG: hypothetical protein CL398_12610 [Acidiferrobacteraceae bacterium]|nr:hypothetical protein [Acidiferrobacteraceae bacterium]|tara:strand:+ start:1631 stop:2005 length:375 start_codon:yes stop_codon:yes gene_type:complete
MGFLCASILALATVEICFRLPIVARIRRFQNVIAEACSVIIRKDLSDDEKQQLALRNALSLVTQSAILASMSLGLLVLVFLPAWLIDRTLRPNPSTIENLSAPVPLLLIAVISIIYAIVRRKLQ